MFDTFSSFCVQVCRVHIRTYQVSQRKERVEYLWVQWCMEWGDSHDHDPSNAHRIIAGHGAVIACLACLARPAVLSCLIVLLALDLYSSVGKCNISMIMGRCSWLLVGKHYCAALLRACSRTSHNHMFTAWAARSGLTVWSATAIKSLLHHRCQGPWTSERPRCSQKLYFILNRAILCPQRSSLCFQKAIQRS